MDLAWVLFKFHTAYSFEFPLGKRGRESVLIIFAIPGMITWDVYFQDELFVRNIFTSSIPNWFVGQTISSVSFSYMQSLWS